MNCDELPLLLNAALDGELTSAERAAMEQHLAECAQCREQWMDLQSLDQALESVLTPPSIDSAVERAIQSIAGRLDKSNPEPDVEARLKHPGRPAVRIQREATLPIRRDTLRRGSKSILFAIGCTLLITCGVLIQWPVSMPAVAEIALTTGSVDVKQGDSKDWVAVKESSRVPLTAHARIRTQPKSLCEIHTQSKAVVRLNQETELILHRPERVELVAGELWCRAPAKAGLEICSGSAPYPSQNSQIFTCPSSTEMQWKTLPNRELSCQDVSKASVDVIVDHLKCTISPGECVTFQSGHPQPKTTQSNPVTATNWQIPLLALGDPHDSDLRRRLTDLLASAGRSKAAYLYEQQIRQLGPVGAVPLLAFVRSEESFKDRSLRYRAMTLAAEMAAQASLQDLEVLLHDKDPHIQQLSLKGLTRLQPDRDFSGQ